MTREATPLTRQQIEGLFGGIVFRKEAITAEDFWVTFALAHDAYTADQIVEALAELNPQFRRTRLWRSLPSSDRVSQSFMQIGGAYILVRGDEQIIAAGPNSAVDTLIDEIPQRVRFADAAPRKSPPDVGSGFAWRRIWFERDIAYDEYLQHLNPRLDRLGDGSWEKGRIGQSTYFRAVPAYMDLVGDLPTVKRAHSIIEQGFRGLVQEVEPLG